jgi:Tat protein translocase TatB subunit
LFGGRGKISDLMGDVAKGIKSFRQGLNEPEPGRMIASDRSKTPRQKNRTSQDKVARNNMFDFSWSHILIVLIVALVVVGPKDLPKLMRIVGHWVGKARAMADQFRKSFDEMARQSELDELRQEIEALRAAPTAGRYSEHIAHRPIRCRPEAMRAIEPPRSGGEPVELVAPSP